METQVLDRRQKLIAAATDLIRRRGYTGTTVELICAEAGVTKGSFFHYFATKEEICEAALDAWMGGWDQLIAGVRFDEIEDPLDRLNALFDLMTSAYLQTETLNGCLVGTVAQEIAPSNRRLGDRCEAHLDSWHAHTTQLLADAKAAHPTTVDFDPKGVAMHMMSIVQGSLLIAKTMRDPAVIANSIAHSRAYVNSLFAKPRTEGNNP